MKFVRKYHFKMVKTKSAREAEIQAVKMAPLISLCLQVFTGSSPTRSHNNDTYS